jgi:3-methyl-2-oxobutanoate hydroxymethyltransferase
MKRRGEKLVMVTAYDAPSGRLADAAGVDLVLVGDTAAMVVLGHASTVPVSFEEMLFLTAAVSRSTLRALVVGDLPFGSYEASDSQAVGSAVRMVKEGGADLVKLEGAGRMADRLRAIAEANIAVVGHVGLTPQSATRLGGFRAQGRTAASALALLDEALSLERAGAVAVVLEAVPPPVAAVISERLSVPTIGIGAGEACDGQVLVWHDLLGLYPGPTPRFVRRYAELGAEIDAALRSYVADVRTGAFPEAEHTYSIPEQELTEFEAALAER